MISISQSDRDCNILCTAASNLAVCLEAFAKSTKLAAFTEVMIKAYDPELRGFVDLNDLDVTTLGRYPIHDVLHLNVLDGIM